MKNTNQRNNSDRNNNDRNNSDRNNSDRGIYLQSVQYHFHSMFTNAISTQINFSNALAKENEKRQQQHHNNNNTRKKNNNSEPRSLRPAVPARLTWVATMERHRERTKAEPLSSEMLLKERLMEMNTGGLLLSIRSKSLVVDITRCLLPVVSVLLPLLVRVFLKFNTAECFSLSWVTNIFKAGKRRRQRQQRDRSKKKQSQPSAG